MNTYPVLNWVARHEDVWVSGDIAPRINLGARWRWVVSYTPPGRFTHREILIFLYTYYLNYDILVEIWHNIYSQKYLRSDLFCVV